MINEMLNKLLDKTDLTFNEAEEVAELLMHGKINNAQIAALLTALHIKGETPNEIAGFANAMRSNGLKLDVSQDNLIDVCGTGGDNSGTFNISTAVAFVVAGAGVKVAKHGNRSITSKSGSSDVLQELGVNIELTPDQSVVAINTIGISFLFAPIYHPAMRYVAPVRQELGFKTIFNVLGPLTNPANTTHQMIGTFNKDIALKMAEAAKTLGMERVAFVCTNNQYDEITLTHTSEIVELNNSQITVTEMDTSTFGYDTIELSDIEGGTPNDNAQIIFDLFSTDARSIHFNVVAANATLALYTSGKYSTLLEAQNAAEDSILSGKALKKLKQLIDFGKDL
ncbi:MAG: anthranilate phosphoribosyltransferase [Melioribacteraceae bacterium]|jgi:anthranilate phosphoribosyltransferase|nr:anthranilate phosphoribosyltransferase [Melioribacteraceae bacterium]